MINIRFIITLETIYREQKGGINNELMYIVSTHRVARQHRDERRGEMDDYQCVLGYSCIFSIRFG